jgi:hypothetical protein
MSDQVMKQAILVQNQKLDPNMAVEEIAIFYPSGNPYENLLDSNLDAANVWMYGAPGSVDVEPLYFGENVLQAMFKLQGQITALAARVEALEV